MGTEFERKYAASPEALDAVEAEFGTPEAVIAMETTYYDTPEGALARRRFTLRRRMENGSGVCTLKTPGGDHDRNEYECPGEDILAAVETLLGLGAPEEVKILVSGGVTPVCGARFTRRTYTLVREDFTAELALDEGVLTGGGREMPLCELEAELKAGARQPMCAFADGLARRYGLTPERRSKFRRALDLAKGV